jgi:hypothetical protein
VEKCGISGQATDDNVIERVGFACRIFEATDTHSAYVTLIAFPLQQWLRERASVLRYTYLGCRVLNRWRAECSHPFKYRPDKSYIDVR